MQMIAHLIVTLLTWLFHWCIILPVSLVFVTPFILAKCFYERDFTWACIRERYAAVIRSFAEFWESGGYGFGP